MMKPDFKAAREWAAKYEKIQGDSTLGNFMRAHLELERLARAYFVARNAEQENHHKAMSDAYSQKERREYHRLAPMFANTFWNAEHAFRDALGEPE